MLSDRKPSGFSKAVIAGTLMLAGCGKPENAPRTPDAQLDCWYHGGALHIRLTNNSAPLMVVDRELIFGLAFEIFDIAGTKLEEVRVSPREVQAHMASGDWRQRLIRLGKDEFVQRSIFLNQPYRVFDVDDERLAAIIELNPATWPTTEIWKRLREPGRAHSAIVYYGTLPCPPGHIEGYTDGEVYLNYLEPLKAQCPVYAH